MTLREMLLTTPPEEMSAAKTKFFEDFIRTSDIDMIKDDIFDIEWITPVQLTITTCVLMYLCYEVIGPYGFTQDVNILNEYEDMIYTQQDLDLLGPVRGETIDKINGPRKTRFNTVFPEWFKDPRTYLPEKYIVVNRRGFLRRLHLDSLPDYFRERNFYLIH